MAENNKRIPYLKECYNMEIQRCSKVEQKATTYIGMLSVVATILANGIIRLLQDGSKLPSGMVALSLIFLTTISALMVVSIYYGIQAVRKRTYSYINPDDVHSNYKDEELEAKLCDDYKQAIRNNQTPTNAKVDAMDRAQKYMLAATILVAVYAITATIIYFFKSYITICLSFTSFCEKLSLIFTTPVIAFLALIIAIVAVIIASIALWYISKLNRHFMKCKKKEMRHGIKGKCMLCLSEDNDETTVEETKSDSK